MYDILSSWPFIIFMICVQVLLILSPLVVAVVVLVKLRRRAKGKEETKKPQV
jgi:hypothetical protein